MDYETELMAQYETKNHQPYLDFRWTKKVIESCLNEWHVERCHDMIENFKKRYSTHDGLVINLKYTLNQRYKYIKGE